jgi:hypothetical protein
MKISEFKHYLFKNKIIDNLEHNILERQSNDGLKYADEDEER